MQFSNLVKVALCASTISAAALPAAEHKSANVSAAVVDVDVVIGQLGTKEVASHHDKRAVVATIAATVGTAALTEATVLAVDAVVKAISGLFSSLSQWTPAREAFTKDTVAGMWSRNPNKSLYPAVVCYNMGYGVSNNAHIVARTSVKFTLGSLHTDYDCMYLQAPQQFWTYGDGGYINLAYMYDGGRCNYDSSTGDLNCP